MHAHGIRKYHKEKLNKLFPIFLFHSHVFYSDQTAITNELGVGNQHSVYGTMSFLVWTTVFAH